jgi:hypothetical protein
LTGKEQEAEHLRAILKANLGGLEDFVTDERYTVLVGKMAYNAYGISPASGRDDKVREFLLFFPLAMHCGLCLREGIALAKRPTGRYRVDAHTKRHHAPNRCRILPRFILRESSSLLSVCLYREKTGLVPTMRIINH